MSMVAIHSVRPDQEWNHRTKYEREKQSSHLIESTQINADEKNVKYILKEEDASSKQGSSEDSHILQTRCRDSSAAGTRWWSGGWAMSRGAKCWSLSCGRGSWVWWGTDFRRRRDGRRNRRWSRRRRRWWWRWGGLNRRRLGCCCSGGRCGSGRCHSGWDQK